MELVAVVVEVDFDVRNVEEFVVVEVDGLVVVDLVGILVVVDGFVVVVDGFVVVVVDGFVVAVVILVVELLLEEDLLREKMAVAVVGSQPA